MPYAGGCSYAPLAHGAGHAFKFASVIGCVRSDLAIDGSAQCDIAPFAVDRPILIEENPSTRFVV